MQLLQDSFCRVEIEKRNVVSETLNPVSYETDPPSSVAVTEPRLTAPKGFSTRSRKSSDPLGS
ncbi:MAG: hypothetical protein IPI57_14350 [Candidatus Competibacteraceae bacterium]|nr:hypothetical protein [Candidatus Competibacteraceae bacterium]